jgi:hypothetical protein
VGALTRDNIILAVLLVALTASFYYGWFVDSSHPLGGAGWTDQTRYTHAAQRLFEGHFPTVKQLHYAPTYSLLGALGSVLSRNDPFWSVSYALLIGSAVFVYRGAVVLFGAWFAAILVVLLFAWDGLARTLNYSSEIFAVPWNNQMLFFAFAFFFWVYATRATGPVDLKIVVATGVVGGLLVTTREESVLFCVPLAIVYLVYRHAALRAWIWCGVAAALAALPALIVKTAVLGSPFASGRTAGYTGTADHYFSISRLIRNLSDTVISANNASVDPHRVALFQAAPWLWLAPVGLVIIFASRRFTPLMKWWTGISLFLIAFYLSGNNVSAAKLKFHCLRYMSPGYIALNLAVVVVLFEVWQFFLRARNDAPAEIALEEPAGAGANDETRDPLPVAD